jgi:hypothetical protein
MRCGLTIAMAVGLAACGSTGSTASPTAQSSGTAGSSSVPSAISTVAPISGPKTLQSDTDWGRIWDGLPSGFPTYPGATPDEAAAGPASAVVVVKDTDAKTVASFLQTELQKAGFTTAGSPEPLEDGSVVLDMTGSPKGCALQVTAKPTGSLTTLTILYGAACPLG